MSNEASTAEMDFENWLKCLDQLPLAVFFVNAAAVPVYLNRQAQHLISEGGAQGAEAINGRDLLHLVKVEQTDRDRPYPRDRFPLALALSGEKAFADDVTIRLSGKAHFYQVAASPMQNSVDDTAFVVVTFLDISEQKNMETELKWRNLELESLFQQVSRGKENLRVLSSRLLTVQEEERRRIARELHDDIGQALTVLKIKLQTLPKTVEGKQYLVSLKDLEELLDSVDQTLQQVRNLSVDLRPSVLDDLGLVAALRWYVDRQNQVSGIDMKFQAPPKMVRIAPEVETACFRMVQEALTNAIRHAGADSAEVTIEKNQTFVQIEVRDNGKGFDVRTAEESARSGNSSGLLGMKERVQLAGGRMDIRSAPGKGTRIKASFPVLETNKEGSHP